MIRAVPGESVRRGALGPRSGEPRGLQAAPGTLCAGRRALPGPLTSLAGAGAALAGASSSVTKGKRALVTTGPGNTEGKQTLERLLLLGLASLLGTITR